MEPQDASVREPGTTNSGDDQWIPTLCYMCYGCCGIKVRRVNGRLVEVEGHKGHPHGEGRMCAKGKASLMSLYDPYRLKTPLKRTNPKKGMGIDPQWVQISWDEALDLIVEKMKKIKEEDPRKLLFLGQDFYPSAFYSFFCSAYGSPNRVGGPSSYFCGPPLHLANYLMQGVFYAEIDLSLCSYCLMIGSQEGFMVNTDATVMTGRMAEARARGMKVVVVDPVCTNAAAKADEWIPIRPGTDGALALAILNLLLNELSLYDAQFIQRYSNGPYLIKPDGHYLREAKSNKPCVWDKADARAKAYDSFDLEDPAIVGSYQLQGVQAIPAFHMLKEHVKKYTPEMAAEITTVPAPTIRRIAQEFGEAARIGSKIAIQGKEIPFRPAAAVFGRGAGAHKHGGMVGLAVRLLNVVVGALDVPGGLLGVKAFTPFAQPREGPEGLLVPGAVVHQCPYPARPVRPPERVTLVDLFPVVASEANPVFEEGLLNPDRYQLPYRVEAVIHVNSNFMMGASSPARMAQVLARVPFMVSISLYLDETAELADIVLPDAHFLERLVLFYPTKPQGLAVGPGPWYWPIQQPAVPPPGEARFWLEVFLEMAERIGILSDFYTIVNTQLKLSEPFRLDPKKRYTWAEMVDLMAKSWYGPEHDLEWFRRHGVLIAQNKKVEEAYPRPFIKPRVPIYFEHFRQAGEEVKRATQKLGILWDTSDYQPLPEWQPCPAHQENSAEYDLYAINFKVPFHAFSLTPENPWLDEVAQHNPYAYKILINSKVAQEKNIRDGDLISLESKVGNLKGRARVTELVHPEVVGIAGAFGHWCEGMPVAKGKGASHNHLLPSTLDYIDTLSSVLDACVKVKVSKARQVPESYKGEMGI